MLTGGGPYPGGSDAVVLIGCSASGAPKPACTTAGRLRIPAHPLHQAGPTGAAFSLDQGREPQIIDHGDD